MKNKKTFLIILYILLISAQLSSQSTNEAYFLFSKGDECFKAGDYNTALIYYQKAAPVYEKVYGKDHLYTGDAYFFLGLSYSKIKQYEKAIAWLKKSFDVYNAPHGDKQSAANSLNAIANVYFNNSDYDTALQYFQQELALRKSTVGENDNETAKCYGNIGLTHEFKGEYRTALQYFEKALAIHQKIFGENNLETATSYHDIALENYYLGNYQEALQYFFKALKIREDITGAKSYEAAHTLGAIATIYIDTEAYAEALRANEIAEEIYSECINPVSSEFAILYNERGRIYYRLEDYKNALKYYCKSLELYSQVYHEKNIYTAKAYLNIGLVYHAMGDYSRAVANLEKAIEIDTAIFGNSHPDIALSYRSLGEVYRAKSDFDTALLYFTKALEMYKNSLGEKHIEVARTYTDIGSIYENKEEFQIALDYYRKGNNITYKIFGYETIQNAQSFENIARIYDIIGEHEAAESLYNGAVEIYKRSLGEKSASTAVAYCSLAWHFARLNDTKRTVAAFKKAYGGFRLSTNYNQTITALTFILRDAQLYQYDTDTDFMRETIKLAVDTTERAMGDLSSKKFDILQQMLPVYYYGVDIEAKNANPSKAFEYSEALRSRSFLDQIGLERALSLDGVTDAARAQIKSLKNKITVVRAEIEKQNSLPPENRDTKKLTQSEKDLAAVEKELARLDKTIAQRLPAYTQLRNPQTAKIKDAQKWCGKDRAVLEYVLWNPKLLSGTNMESDDRELQIDSYCLVITNKSITAIPLNLSYDYDSAIVQLREAITHKPIKSELSFEKQRNELYEHLVKPILPHIGRNIKKLLIVPDGNVSFLPFDILRENSESKDIGEKYAISFSPSVSVSIVADKIKSESSDVSAFGGAWYDKSLSEEEHERIFQGKGTRGIDRGLSAVSAQTKLTEHELRKLIEQEGDAKYFEQKHFTWYDLPGTVLEVETLQKTIFKNADIKTQKSATESLLKNLSKQGMLSKYAVLHFACHGYFDSDVSEMSSVLFSEVSEKLNDVSDDDGYLTVGEAATLNLAAQMVCLSACQTGLGKIQKGQGLVGLSRAFIAAGAKNVGVTLWSVNDEATTEFMLRIYKKVKRGMSFSAAYQKVKNEFRNDEYYSHPYYWAAFILYE